MYYFFDNRIVKSASGVELTLGSVTKRVTNASWLDQYKWTADSDIPEWENRVTIMYPHVIYDENGVSVDGVTPVKYKMWYHSYCTKAPASDYKWFDFIIDKDNSRGVDIGDLHNNARGTFHWQGFALCYMESPDGISWTRPDCGEFYYKKQNGEIVGTNIVLIGNHGTGVHINTHPKAGAGEPRYLMATTGTGISWSEDGIHWEKPVIIKDGNKTDPWMPGDTHNQLLWSPELQRYVVISRGYIDKKIRTVIQFSSKDSLTSLRLMGEDMTYEERSAYWTEPRHVLYGASDAQPYSAPIIYADKGCYIGIVSIADFEINTKGTYQQVYAGLIWSPDGERWEYIKGGEPFIKNDSTFRLMRGNDYGMIYCAAPVVTGETTKIFYAATPELHYFKYSEIPDGIKEVMRAEIPLAVEDEFITRTTTLSFAEFVTDRYAGYKGIGSVTTTTFTITGDHIRFNAEGEVTVALLDPDGKVIEGFDHGDFSADDYSSYERRMRWKGDTVKLVGRTVFLEFRLNGATLYTVGGNIER